MHGLANQLRAELLVLNTYRLRLDRALRFRLSVMNAFYLFPSISEEADPLHGYNYTRRYPIGKGGKAERFGYVSLAMETRRGRSTARRDRSGARSEADPRTEGPKVRGGAEGLARNPWPDRSMEAGRGRIEGARLGRRSLEPWPIR